MAKIGLIFPCTNPSWPGAEINKWDYKGIPIGLLSIASYLEFTGHKVKIIDTMMYTKSIVTERVNELVDWADAIGFSVMTTQVRHALALSNYIKELSPNMPIIWGGIHPTLFPEQTCADTSVDYVIYGEGEYAMDNLLHNFITGEPRLGKINNLVYKTEGRVVKNSTIGLLDVNKLPKLAYHLLDIDKYINREVLSRPFRGIDILTSRGCPYRCTFCANTILLEQKWRPRALTTVFEEMDELITKYDLNFIWLIDDYFFGSRRRAQAVAQHIVDKGYNISWEANIRANDLASNRLDDKYIALMKKSGLIGLKIGAESGSNEILKLLKKDITVEQVVKAVDRCVKQDIIPYLFFLHGIPGETIEEIKKTSYFMFKLKSQFPDVVLNGPGVFRPYPGSELYRHCLKLGFHDPATLNEWAKRDLGANYLPTRTLPWIPKPKLVDDLNWYLYKACREDRILKYRFAWPRKVLGRMAKWRFQHNFWKLRFESRLVEMVRNLRDRIQKA